MESARDLSLRDYFAGQALTALIIQSTSLSLGGDPVRKKGSLFAERAYEFADAMLEERKKREALHANTVGSAHPV
jgi:hypothetical protein